MARKYYQLLFGMKEHPETFAERSYPALKTGEVFPGGYISADEHQLLYSGDVFEVEELLLQRDPSLGGWTERAKDGTPVIACARPVDADRESWTARDEPSRVGGYNISTRDLAELERREEDEAHRLAPLPPVAASTATSVKKAARG